MTLGQNSAREYVGEVVRMDSLPEGTLWAKGLPTAPIEPQLRAAPNGILVCRWVRERHDSPFEDVVIVRWADTVLQGQCGDDPNGAKAAA